MYGIWLVTTMVFFTRNSIKGTEVILVPSTHLDLDFTRPPLESLELYDSFLEPGHVILSVLKPAFDGQGYVLRCVETQDKDAEVTLSSDLGFTTAVRTTLIEENREVWTLTEGRFRLPIWGHKLKTIRLRRLKTESTEP